MIQEGLTYRDGYDAYNEGKSIHANPFSDPLHINYRNWVAGWNAARDRRIAQHVPDCPPLQISPWRY